jgi:hypothetical protein
MFKGRSKSVVVLIFGILIEKGLTVDDNSSSSGSSSSSIDDNEFNIAKHMLIMVEEIVRKTCILALQRLWLMCGIVVKKCCWSFH